MAGLPLQGVRIVDACIYWAGHLAPGKLRHPIQVVDWMPTFAALLETTVPGRPRWDGCDMWPVLSGQHATPPDGRAPAWPSKSASTGIPSTVGNAANWPSPRQWHA